MPSLTFYAARSDHPLVLDFIFDQPGWRLAEQASEYDQPLRYFDSTAGVVDAMDLDGPGANLLLHVPEAGGSVVEQWHELKMRDRPEAKGWTHAEGWGLIQLNLRGFRDGVVHASWTNHNTETRALAFEAAYPHLGPVAGWDFKAVTRASRRLNHHITRVAIDKWTSRWILPEAAALRSCGAILQGDVDARPVSPPSTDV